MSNHTNYETPTQSELSARTFLKNIFATRWLIILFVLLGTAIALGIYANKPRKNTINILLKLSNSNEIENYNKHIQNLISASKILDINRIGLSPLTHEQILSLINNRLQNQILLEEYINHHYQTKADRKHFQRWLITKEIKSSVNHNPATNSSNLILTANINRENQQATEYILVDYAIFVGRAVAKLLNDNYSEWYIAQIEQTKNELDIREESVQTNEIFRRKYFAGTYSEIVNTNYYKQQLEHLARLSNLYVWRNVLLSSKEPPHLEAFINDSSIMSTQISKGKLGPILTGAIGAINGLFIGLFLAIIRKDRRTYDFPQS